MIVAIVVVVDNTVVAVAVEAVAVVPILAVFVVLHVAFVHYIRVDDTLLLYAFALLRVVS
jgi:hypothetical protein